MKMLGQALIESGILDQRQLALGLAEQKRTGELLGDALLRLGVITRRDLALAMAGTSGLPFVDLARTPVDPAAVERVPEETVKRYKVLPFGFRDGVLKVAMHNPSDVVAIDALRRGTGLAVEPCAADPDGILERIELHYGVGSSLEEDVDRHVAAALSGGPGEDGHGAPVIRLLELFLVKALRDGATDVHINPEPAVIRVSYRVDGLLGPGFVLPKQLHSAIVTRVKVLGRMNIAEQRLPQEGSLPFVFAGRSLDVRSSTMPGQHGENIVLRVLDKADILVGLDRLGLDRRQKAVIERLSAKPHGIVLAAGPTGSGKTTTMYSMLRGINALERNILTIEDPVEYRIPLIKQTQVNEQAGLTFARALRSFLRQDPDVILVGEIRDLETARAAFQAAMTGHLVLSTIHTNDAAATIPRLMDLGVEPYLIPTSLRAVVAQRLIRRVCPECARTRVPDEEELAGLELADWKGAGRPVRGAVGCPACRGTGYRGRLGIFEILEVTPPISRLIAERASADVIARAARREGMPSLRDDGLRKVLAGQSTLEEVCRVT